jgi:hypothetical protein
MSRFGAKFGHTQEQAIVALMTYGTIEKAARTLNVSSRTLMRWQQKPEFQAAFRKARRDALAQSIARFAKGAPAAVATLFNVMVDSKTPAAVRVRAADSFLHHTWKAMEIDAIDGRVASADSDTDPNAELGNELAGILRGIVESAAPSRRESARVPLEVNAVEPRRPEADQLQEFLRARCIVAAEGDVESWKSEKCWVPVAELYPNYAVWAAANGDRQRLPKGSFEKRLHELGREKARVRPAGGRGTKQVWVWFGIRFSTAGEDESVPCDKDAPV